MSRLADLGRGAGQLGLWAGLASAGAAVGFAAERYSMGRSLRGEDPYAREPFGQLRGTQVPVRTDDGVDLFVEVDEPAAGVETPLTVVFAHGYALNRHAWHFQRRDLRGRARLVFWDQRAHGSSGAAPEGSVSIDRLGQDLGAVVDAVAPTGPVVLVGHSMGGMTVLSLLRQHPELVTDRRVVGVGLVTTSARGVDGSWLGLRGPLGRGARRVAPAVVATLAKTPELIERGRRYGSDIGYVVTRRYSFAPGVAPSLVEFTARMNAETPIGVLSDFLEVLGRDLDLLSALDVVRPLPVAVVGAEKDLLLPVEHSREIAEALPDAAYLELAETGHMALLDCHEAVTAHLVDLLDRSDDRAAAGTRHRAGGGTTRRRAVGHTRSSRRSG